MVNNENTIYTFKFFLTTGEIKIYDTLPLLFSASNDFNLTYKIDVSNPWGDNMWVVVLKGERNLILEFLKEKEYISKDQKLKEAFPGSTELLAFKV